MQDSDCQAYRKGVKVVMVEDKKIVVFLFIYLSFIYLIYKSRFAEAYAYVTLWLSRWFSKRSSHPIPSRFIPLSIWPYIPLVTARVTSGFALRLYVLFYR